ncbi:nitroreductase [Novosphingobium sp. PhB57]|uniref:nitroreductase n=1 Tax=Novosphingobium sp. PhB57 TaxID=2485107 RepID=UPI001046F972|nr:nitroreductase [Novosphingobium sp. PhB57]TCU54688.1 nitroreductase [Novosphingobium sp. PhB57]
MTQDPISAATSVDDRLMLPFDETVRVRRSYRDFLAEPLPNAVIREVLLDAQHAPSNCNTQPWNMHIVSGAKRDDLSKALHEANVAGRLTPDFSWDEGGFEGRYDERRREQGAIYYRNLGVARDDRESRAKASGVNFSFFNAPHVALLFMPVVGDSVRVAGDLGMYGQTFLLALAARGLGGVPQTVLGLYAQTVRDVLGVSQDLKLLYGISFGYPDEAASANRVRMGRDELARSVTFHS